MTLQNIKQLKNERGFTIVELLIVIVIIGILAALVIVAYTGIQNRAKTTKYQTDALALVKKIEAYNSVNGGYPVTASTPNGITNGGTGATQVVTAMNSTSNKEANLPATDIVYWVNAANTAPTVAQMTAAIAASTTQDAYYVSYCATGGGVNVYYPDVANNAVKTLTAGTCP